ncbi:sulfate/molybdate ABC transporter ATP-binding protein [Petrocella sp. FN5]|uniref:sulfate/molybdate ABC transporter ATP-binding protein n=1 Tax=Petrocella sp. FN5 TaxID=3032002 RepID=UPI0023DB0A92|nr:ATP-binding cassette domain-containing protein [Petrocella sp. FN5]MDF1617513.1 ATP-binding cassette domain-containing protein [Petrocella sp. FN5]
MLEVSLKKTLGKFTLQSSFTADKGVLGILGASGCGKSMTLKCISGLQTPDEGSIRLNGALLFSSESKVNIPSRERNIGYVFQNYALFPHLTVKQNIAYGMKHFEKSQRAQKVTHMIEKMQLKGLEHHYPSQLSGGQQQRTALARTLITEPDLLFLDEPFSALDSHIKYLLEKELMKIIKENFNGIVLLVTHNIEEAYRICDQIMIMDDGQNLQLGPKEDIISKPINLTTARITGCKNILDVSILEEHKDYLLLKSNALIFKAANNQIPLSDSMLAGIRAHHLRLYSEKSHKDNVFDCEIMEKIEGVFSTTIIVNCGGNVLQLEIAKASCPHISESNNNKIKLHIPMKHVFLMENEL